MDAHVARFVELTFCYFQKLIDVDIDIQAEVSQVTQKLERGMFRLHPGISI